jgi:AraC-like DNA-binding protein
MKEKLTLPAGCEGDLWPYRYLGPHPIHRHEELEFNLVLSGRAVYLVNSRRIELVPNSVLWLFPAQDHVLLEVSVDFRMWILVARPRLVRQVCTDDSSEPLRALNPAGSFCRHLSSSQARKLIALFEDLCHVKSEMARFNAGLGYALLTAWSAYGAAGVVPLEEDVHPAISRVVRLMAEDSPIPPDDGGHAYSLANLAEAVGLNTYSLSRLFKSQTGITLTAYRNRRRVERFLELYGHGQNTTLLATALEAGFGSYAQFYRVFRQLTGVTPATYRRSLQEGTAMAEGL